MVGLAVIQLYLGNLRAACRWALWPGSVLSIEVLLRCCGHISCLALQRTPVGDKIEKGIQGPYASFLTLLKGFLQMKVHQNVEYEPLRE